MNFVLRKAVVGLTALFLLMLPAATMLSAAVEMDNDGYADVICEDDFETGVINSTKFSFQTNAAARPATIVQSPVDVDEHGYVVAVPTMGVNGVTDHFFRTNYSLVNKNYSTAMLEGEAVERLQQMRCTVDVMFPEYMSLNVHVIGHKDISTRTSLTMTKFTEGGSMYVSGASKSMKYELNTWYSLIFDIDLIAKKYTMYLNGEVFEADMPFNITASYLLSFGVQKGKASFAQDSFAYTDNISYRVATAPTVQSVSPAADYQDFPVQDGEVLFTFDGTIDESCLPTVQVTDKDGEPVNTAISVDGTDLTVRFTEQLEFNTDYIITIPAGITGMNGKVNNSPITHSIHTIPSGMYTGALRFTEVPADFTVGGTVTAEVAIGSPESEADAVLAVAAYDENGAMLALETDEVTVPADIMINSSVSLNIAGASKVCAFVLGGGEQSTPICSDVLVLTDEGVEKVSNDASLTAEAEIDNFTVDGISAKFEGSVSEEGVRLLIARVEKNGNLMWIAPVFTQDNGSFSAIYSSDELEDDGDYKLIITGRRMPEAITDAYYYFSVTSQLGIKDSVNQASSAAAIKTTLAPYEGILDVATGAFCDVVYQTLYEQRPMESFEALLTLMNHSYTLFGTVNNTNWSTMAEILTNDENILLNGHADVSYFKALSRTEQNKVCRYMVQYMPVDDFLELRVGFGKAVIDYKNSLQAHSGSSDGGNSSYIVTTGVTKPEQTQKPTSVKPIFNDLTEVSWAEESILSLAQRGILSGDGNGSFRPNDSITREEFVKLLLGGLGIAPVDGNSGFEDEEIGAWYASWLTAARQAEIVNGDENGNFGVGQRISRQDMAVMVFRAIESTEGESLVSGVNVTFADQTEISDYAVDAVKWMRQEELLSGMGDNRFAPLENASRAQAAKLIDSLLQWKYRRNNR